MMSGAACAPTCTSATRSPEPGAHDERDAPGRHTRDPKRPTALVVAVACPPSTVTVASPTGRPVNRATTVPVSAAG
jgi:hypothetical protein